MKPNIPSSILAAKWEPGKGKTLMKYCGPDKVIKIVEAGMHPYLFIRESDLEEARKFFKNRVVRVEQGQFIAIDGYKVAKIVLRHPSDVQKKYRGKYHGLRPDLESVGIVTYESDIPFVRRWMIDQQIFQCEISKKAYVDIEVEARAGFPDVEEAENRILSIAISGSDGQKFFFCQDNEQKMLLDYYAAMRKHYHMVTGWNWRNFDGQYLRNRTWGLGLKVDWVPLQEIDAMINYTKLCLWENMPVLTPGGHVQIADIGEYTGEKECIAVQTDDGFWFIGSFDQELRTPDGWKTLAQLDIMSEVLCINTTKHVKLPDWYDKELRVLWRTLRDRERSKRQGNKSKEVLFSKLLLETSTSSKESRTSKQQRMDEEAMGRPRMESTSRGGSSVGKDKVKKCRRFSASRRDEAESTSTRDWVSRGQGLHSSIPNSIERSAMHGGLLVEGQSYCRDSSVIEVGQSYQVSSTSSSKVYCVDETWLPSYMGSSLGHREPTRGSEEAVEVCTVKQKVYVGRLPTYDIETRPFNNYLVNRLNTHNTIWGFVGKSYSLENVAKEHLGIDTQKMKMSPEEMWDSFCTDHKALYDYNMMDADIVRELDTRLRICDPYIEITKIYPLLLNDAPFMSRVIDVVLLNEAIKHPWRLVFPKKVHHTGELLGGKTLKPDAGVHSGVFSLDFKSLYPSVIISFGLSPEVMYLFQAWRQSRKALGDWITELFTVECSDSRLPPPDPVPIPKPRKDPSKPDRKPKPLSAEEKYAHWKEHYREQVEPYVYFCHKLQELELIPYPFMAHELTRLLDLRAEIKDRMKSHPEGSIGFMAENIRQAAVKLVLVSSYGVTGYRNTRFFNAEFVNATTGLSQTVLDITCEIADELGYKVLYGDTDSVFLKPKGADVHPLELTSIIGTFEDKCNEALRERLISEFELDPEEYIVELSAENVYSKITLTRVKKKYIADCIWVEGEFVKKRKVTGFETKRSDTFELLSDLQVMMVDILHSEEIEADQVEGKIHSLCGDMIEEMYNGEYDKKLILSMTLQKGGPDDYETTSPHVRVARKLQEMGEYRPGDKVKWIVIDDGDEAPVLDLDDDVPRPSPRGYKYYAEKLKDCVERMIDSKPRFEVGADGNIYEQTTLGAYEN